MSHLGPVHTYIYPDIFESTTFPFRIRLPSTRIRQVRTLLNPFSRVENNNSATNPITCGWGNFWIRKEKVADSKISGYVWTRPYLPRANVAHDLSLGGSKMHSGHGRHTKNSPSSDPGSEKLVFCGCRLQFVGSAEGRIGWALSEHCMSTEISEINLSLDWNIMARCWAKCTNF